MIGSHEVITFRCQRSTCYDLLLIFVYLYDPKSVTWDVGFRILNLSVRRNLNEIGTTDVGNFHTQDVGFVMLNCSKKIVGAFRYHIPYAWVILEFLVKNCIRSIIAVFAEGYDPKPRR